MRVIAAIVVLSYYISASVASPLLARSTNDTKTVSFVTQDNNRDTVSLLVSCTLTLILCVYTAVHLNIPAKNETRRRTFLRELWWCLIGINGPELILFTAWRQWSSAKALSSGIKKTQIGAEKISRPAWSTVHGLYAGMGGFAIETSSFLSQQDKDAFPTGKRYSLTPRGVLLLAQCGHLPNICTETIKDKSKVDTMAKALVILQAGWFSVQVIARLAAGLPVTLLEINTIGHVTCALVMYILWWKKPRQVREPTLLEGDWLPRIAAYMFISSRVSGVDSTRARRTPLSRPDPEIAKLAYFPTGSPHDFRNEAKCGMYVETSALVQEGAINQAGSEVSSAQVRNNPSVDELSSSGCFAYRPKFLRSSTFTIEHVENEDFHKEPPAGVAHRWALAAEAIALHPEIAARFKKPADSTSHTTGEWLEGTTEDLLVDSASNWPTNELMRNVDGLMMGMILWTVSMVYGAIHLAAWNDFFPTTAERWLWRSSALWMSASGLIWSFINFAAHAMPRIDVFWLKFMQHKTPWWSYPLVYGLCTICGSAYVFARAFLVIEAFISVRKLPVAAYDTPRWVQLVPHL